MRVTARIVPGLASAVGLEDGELAGLEDGELAGIVRSLRPGSGRRDAACELLVSRYRPLVRSCVRRYKGGAEPVEDLMQVGYVGLMKAISNFDPAVGGSLAAYAQAHITGEIKNRMIAPTKRSNIHLITRSQSVIGASNTSRVGTLPR